MSEKQLKAALQALLANSQRARQADDAQRYAEDEAESSDYEDEAVEALNKAMLEAQDAHASLIIAENEARKALAAE